MNSKNDDLNKDMHPIDLAKDELEFLILLTLMELESLSIKNLIRLLDSSKATIYRKIGSLIEQGLIEIDPIKTANKSGKYYKVTKKTINIFQNDQTPDSPSEGKLYEKMKKNPKMVAEGLINGIRSLNLFNLSLINIFKEPALGNIEYLTEELRNGYITGSLMTLELATKKEKEEIKKLVREFIDKLEKYSRKGNNLTDNSYPVYLSIFPLSRKQVFALLDEE